MIITIPLVPLYYYTVVIIRGLRHFIIIFNRRLKETNATLHLRISHKKSIIMATPLFSLVIINL